MINLLSKRWKSSSHISKWEGQTTSTINSKRNERKTYSPLTKNRRQCIFKRSKIPKTKTPAMTSLCLIEKLRDHNNVLLSHRSVSIRNAFLKCFDRLRLSFWSRSRSGRKTSRRSCRGSARSSWWGWKKRMHSRILKIIVVKKHVFP